ARSVVSRNVDDSAIRAGLYAAHVIDAARLLTADGHTRRAKSMAGGGAVHISLPSAHDLRLGADCDGCGLVASQNGHGHSVLVRGGDGTFDRCRSAGSVIACALRQPTDENAHGACAA